MLIVAGGVADFFTLYWGPASSMRRALERAAVRACTSFLQQHGVEKVSDIYAMSEANQKEFASKLGLKNLMYTWLCAKLQNRDSSA